jgi:hypothetical protein
LPTIPDAADQSSFILLGVDAVRKILGFASLAAVALLAMAPAGGFGQNKKQPWTKSQPMPATAQEYAALMNLKQLPGTVFYLDTGSGSKIMTLRVDIPQYVKNPNYRPPNLNVRPTTNTRNNGRNNSNHSQQMNHLMQQYHQAMHTHARNPAQMQQQQQKMMQIQMQMQNLECQLMMQQGMQAQNYQMQMAQRMAQANSNPNNQPFKINITQKDFELDILDNAAVRKTFLGTEYDDMGNPKQYTKAQIAELKGKDSSKPGYTAKFEDIQPGQEVVLFLAKPAKKSSSSSSKSGVKKADDEKKIDDIKKADDEKKVDDVKKADDDKKGDAVKKADDEKKPAEEKAVGLLLDPTPAKTDRPVITMIVMTKENTSPLTAPPAPAAKKKKN